MKKPAIKWRLIFRVPGEHKFFRHGDNPNAPIAVADNSGRTPDETDDGVLWLQTDQPISLGEGKRGLHCSYKVKTLTGEDAWCGGSFVEAVEMNRHFDMPLIFKEKGKPKYIISVEPYVKPDEEEKQPAEKKAEAKEGDELVLEVNPKAVVDKSVLGGVGPNGPILMLTPPMGEEGYWTLRVKVSPQQAVLGFPKFCTIGIGFEKETDWNTNLPFSCTTGVILNHILRNRAGANPKRCERAVRMIQDAVVELKLVEERQIKMAKDAWAKEEKAKAAKAGRPGQFDSFMEKR